MVSGGKTVRPVIGEEGIRIGRLWRIWNVCSICKDMRRWLSTFLEGLIDHRVHLCRAVACL
jgi:hypothetical protein